jgi:hypothetical protein
MVADPPIRLAVLLRSGTISRAAGAIESAAAATNQRLQTRRMSGANITILQSARYTLQRYVASLRGIAPAQAGLAALQRLGEGQHRQALASGRKISAINLFPSRLGGTKF